MEIQPQNPEFRNNPENLHPVELTANTIYMRWEDIFLKIKMMLHDLFSAAVMTVMIGILRV